MMLPFKNLNEIEKELSANYFNNVRTLQEDENNTREDSRSQGTALGVDYNLYRRQAAKFLSTQIRRVSNLSNTYVFTQLGKEYYSNILSPNGPTQGMVKKWLVKYEGFSKDSVLLRKYTAEELGVESDPVE